VPYLLDGNNLIGVVQRTSRPSEADRQALVAEIAARLRQTRAHATIFFDGPSGDRTVTLGALSIRAAAGSSADDAIVREVASARRPAESIVVTADRGLASRVREAGGKVLAPSEFFERFGRASSPAHPASAPVDVEDWLRFFGDPSNRDRE
jgi:predicted RNA-binding protein with PIN domain